MKIENSYGYCTYTLEVHEEHNGKLKLDNFDDFLVKYYRKGKKVLSHTTVRELFKKLEILSKPQHQTIYKHFRSRRDSSALIENYFSKELDSIVKQLNLTHDDLLRYLIEDLSNQHLTDPDLQNEIFDRVTRELVEEDPVLQQEIIRQEKNG